MRAVIFDVDGTLIQSMAIDCELYVSSINAILGPVEFRPSFGDYEDVTDRGVVTQLIVDNGLSVASDVIDSIRTHFVESVDKHIKTVGPFPAIRGAPKMVDELKNSSEISVAIATGCWRDSAILKLESSGFNLTGIPIATCDDAPSRAEIMRTALSKLGDRFDSVTYFGDAEWDKRACQSLGWEFVAVGSELGGIQSYESYIPGFLRNGNLRLSD